MKQPNKRTLLIAGGVGVAVLMVVLLVLMFTVWAKPSQQDFKDARETVRMIDDSYEKISATYKKYYDEVIAGFKAKKNYNQVASSTQSLKEEYTRVMADHSRSMTNLKESKALKDPDVMTAYEAFVKKDRLYTTNSDGFVYPLARFRSSFDTCADIYDVTKTFLPTPVIVATKHEEVSKDCLADLDAVAASKPGPLASYGKKYASNVRERQKVFDAVAKNDMSKTDMEKRISELAAEYKTFNPIGEFNKKAKEANLAEELAEIKSVLDRKATQ